MHVRLRQIDLLRILRVNIYGVRRLLDYLRWHLSSTLNDILHD